MKIKVCGITSLKQLQQLQELGIDYAGMIFYGGSKRYIGDKLKNHPDGYREEIRHLSINKVGVFVNEKFETITKAIDDYDLYAVQLHGDETDEFCLELMDKAQVIKVFRLSGEENIDELIKPFLNACHYFMFDNSPYSNLPSTGEGAANTQPLPPLTPPMGSNSTQPLLNQEVALNKDTRKSKVSEWLSSPLGGSRMGAFGGTGLQFDWSILKTAKINKLFFLSGGIGLEDVEKIKSFEHPYLFAVDINSRFETSPGVKNMKKVQRFITELNS